MITGRGDIAGVLKDKEGACFFASGVSNSLEARESEYRREKELLFKQDRSLRLVYFGSLSIFYGNTRYTRHKLEMEELVKTFPRYCIVRLGNITWGSNPHTLINTIRSHVEKQEPLEIKDVYRYVVEKEEFLYWIGLIPDWNCEMNVPGSRMKIREVVKKYVL